MTTTLPAMTAPVSLLEPPHAPAGIMPLLGIAEATTPKMAKAAPARVNRVDNFIGILQLLLKISKTGW
jgi:hypothetical protein